MTTKTTSGKKVSSVQQGKRAATKAKRKPSVVKVMAKSAAQLAWSKEAGTVAGSVAGGLAKIQGLVNKLQHAKVTIGQRHKCEHADAFFDAFVSAGGKATSGTAILSMFRTAVNKGELFKWRSQKQLVAKPKAKTRAKAKVDEDEDEDEDSDAGHHKAWKLELGNEDSPEAVAMKLKQFSGVLIDNGAPYMQFLGKLMLDAAVVYSRDVSKHLKKAD